MHTGFRRYRRHLDYHAISDMTRDGRINKARQRRVRTISPKLPKSSRNSRERFQPSRSRAQCWMTPLGRRHDMRKSSLPTYGSAIFSAIYHSSASNALLYMPPSICFLGLGFDAREFDFYIDEMIMNIQTARVGLSLPRAFNKYDSRRHIGSAIFRMPVDDCYRISAAST